MIGKYSVRNLQKDGRVFVRICRKITCLLLRFCLLTTALAVLPTASAAEEAAGDAVEISLPVITGQNGLVWYTTDDPAGTFSPSFILPVGGKEKELPV